MAHELWGRAMNTVLRDTGSTYPLVSAVSFGHALRFEPLGGEGQVLDFPCDAQGRVDLDALSEQALEAYLYARAMIGRHFHAPRCLPMT
jgi:hypothetical protein